MGITVDHSCQSYNYTRQKKKKLPACSFPIFEMTDGVQERYMSHFYPCRATTLTQKKVPPQLFKIQVEQARSFFF